MKISPPIASTLYVQGDSSHSYSSSPSDETEDYKQLDSPLQVLYNLTKIPRYTLELVRGDIFSNLGASLAHALLLDLRAIGLFIPNIDIKNIYMDKCKIEQRLKWKQMPMKSMMKNVENLLCIGVDGRKKTHYTTRNQWRKMEVKFWKKPKDLMPLSNHKGDTKWEYIFDSQGSSWYWCNWFTIKAVLVDNTNANTGCEGGLVTLLEKIKNKNKSSHNWLLFTSKWTSI